MKSLLTKIISVLTIFLLCVSLTACNSSCNTTSDKCASGHTWKLTSTTATCFDSGVESYKCKVCGETKTENVRAYGHNMVQVSYIAPTCKTNGESVEKCSRCGFESRQPLLAIEHDYQVKSTTPSTCTAHGSTTYECSMCHETKNEQLPLKDHDYVLKNTTPSTCSTKGSKDYECSVCHDTYSDELPLVDHKYELVNTTASTCIEHGTEDYECSVCHDTYSIELPFAEHTYETVTKEATCFTHGGTVEKCSVCQDEKPVSETPLLAHDFGADGYCTHCGIYKTLFDENQINATYKGVVISGNLTAKFNDTGKSISDTYWQDHTVTLTITMYDKDDNELEKHSFNSTTIPHEGNNYGKLTIQYVDVGGRIGNSYANAFIVFVDEGNIFSADNRTNCKSFKIELSCDGYETIEKTYTI